MESIENYVGNEKIAGTSTKLECYIGSGRAYKGGMTLECSLIGSSKREENNVSLQDLIKKVDGLIIKAEAINIILKDITTLSIKS